MGWSRNCPLIEEEALHSVLIWDTLEYHLFDAFSFQKYVISCIEVIRWRVLEDQEGVLYWSLEKIQRSVFLTLYETAKRPAA